MVLGSLLPGVWLLCVCSGLGSLVLGVALRVVLVLFVGLSCVSLAVMEWCCYGLSIQVAWRSSCAWGLSCGRWLLGVGACGAWVGTCLAWTAWAGWMRGLLRAAVWSSGSGLLVLRTVLTLWC